MSHSIHTTNSKKKCITQDMYSVTYNPGFHSFLPTKRGYRNQINFSNTPTPKHNSTKFINNP